MIDNKLVLDWYIESDIDEYHIKPSNCIVCYIPNGFKDNKRNQKIFIKKKIMIHMKHLKNLWMN